jgi:hypothetical protein
MSALRSRTEISNDRRPHFMVLRALPEAKVTQGSSLTRIAGGLIAGWEACATGQPGRLCYAATPSAQHFQECEGILGRGAFGVIVEVDVHIALFLQPALSSYCPFLESGLAIAGCVFAGVPV